MQALKLTVPGQYWDSQIYSGRLYLFDRSASITTLDWDRLVADWAVPAALRLPMLCSFSRSDYLYGSHWELIFGDDDVKRLLLEKFARLASVDLTLNSSRIRELLVGQQDNPFPFPHNDCRIYARRMYIGASEGVFTAACAKKLKSPVSTRVQQRWEGPALSLATWAMTLGIAAGDEGLFETRIGETFWQYPDEDERFEDEVRQVATRSCDDCDWAFGSIFGSSHHDAGFLAMYKVAEMDEELHELAADSDDEVDQVVTANVQDRGSVRRFERLVESSDIFGHSGYTWASRDKICQASDGFIRIAKYVPWNKPSEQLFQIGELSTSVTSGDVVSAELAVFGTVVEFDNELVVYPSNGDAIRIPGEPVRWRVFPRSRHYENQLHVIYDDRLDVWSFNHDYFVSQRDKLIGIAAHPW